MKIAHSVGIYLRPTSLEHVSRRELVAKKHGYIFFVTPNSLIET